MGEKAGGKGEVEVRMMKRKTKEQREAEAKIALRRRVCDIACGAAGYQFDTDGEFATAEFLSRFVSALRAQFEVTDRNSTNDHLFTVANLSHYNDIDTATDFLFRYGVRA